ncbi:non-specific serine/threonine protein kinase [Trachipleistophora hominis]|uniref:non-specific serine/threonine protein kinase n=1 Tax=Trachipleistophora hominis TaxID=72359 RepID=L7JRM2_TRAHO|nr:non-specific serine/threonine protein kinase [Trachipleistophora hominis]
MHKQESAAMRLDDYRFLEKLGNGTHGTVYLLESRESKPKLVVFKSVSSKNLKYALNEIEIIKSLSYKRIVRFYGSMSSNNGMYIMMEHANYGDLERLNCFIREKNLNIDKSIIWTIFSQLIDALAYLHRNRIIHRDIKPGNILLNRVKGRSCNFLQVKLCDFSLSKRLDDESKSNDGMIVGTPYYMAPEIIQKKAYDYSVDVWSMGVVMYELVSKMRPFESESKKELKRQIVFQEIRVLPNCRDFFLKKIVLECLRKEDRISAEELLRLERVKYHLIIAEHRLKTYRLERLERKIHRMSKEKGLEQTIC